MKITDIRTYTAEVPMRYPYITALVNRKVTTSVITVVETDEGITGYGQSSTSAALYSPYEEYLETISQVVERKLKPVLVGTNPFDLEAMHERMQRAAPEL